MQINDIIKIATECRGLVFGGYLRDIIAGKTPKDLDLWFKNKKDAQKFIAEIAEHSESAFSTRLELQKTNEEGFEHLRLFNNEMTLTHIDIIIKHDWMKEDIDINMLYLEDGQIKAWRGDVMDIIHNIYHKQFVPFENCEPERIITFISRGWINKTKGN